MEPTFDIPAETPDNRKEFTAPFFSGIKLKAARNPMTVAGVRKDYFFPTLYADVRCAQGIFHCSFTRPGPSSTMPSAPTRCPRACSGEGRSWRCPATSIAECSGCALITRSP